MTFTRFTSAYRRELLKSLQRASLVYSETYRTNFYLEFFTEKAETTVI